MAQDKKKSVAQIAGENEVLGAPDTPNPNFVAEMKAQQDSVNAALRDDVMFEGEQDPNLRGTGQPGELYGTPTTPDPEFVKEQVSAMNEQAKVWVGAAGSIYKFPDGCNATGGDFKSHEDYQR